MRYRPHTVQAQAADAAGNESAVSAERVFTVVSDNAELRTLELSGIILHETVTGTTYQYTAQVPYGVSSTSIAAVAADSNASVEILQNGRPAANPAALEVGTQTFTIQVTAQDGTTVQPYTVTVTRMPSDEAALSELTVDTAVLIPRFDPGTTDYTASVTHAVYAVTVHARAASEVAALQMNGKLFAGNEGSLPVELDVGSNPVTVTVTAQDGVTVGTYRVDINREPSSNVMLSGLQLSEGSLEPAFESGIVHYETTVDYLTAGTTVTASVYDRNATLSVNGQALTSGEPSRLLPLEVGTNRLAVTVTAQDRVSRQSYIIEVHRKARPNVTLTSLELSGGALLPAFDSGLTAYSVMVGNGVDRHNGDGFGLRSRSPDPHERSGAGERSGFGANCSAGGG
ncbi:cadherin-like beta sandwich domain-containing protein [Paenibacillus sp. TAB 01]|uniref:cadherin-like beta sandwich domain-containing protein n=1 Tax=Paenibacillus sp. TAB 01 TaxID=3368988 RepID=UPI003753C89E